MAACLNAKYGLWTNGDDRYVFAKRTEKKGHQFVEIVELPAAGQTEEDAQKPKRKDLKAAAAHNLLFAFRRCHNYIAAVSLALNSRPRKTLGWRTPAEALNDQLLTSSATEI